MLLCVARVFSLFFLNLIKFGAFTKGKWCVWDQSDARYYASGSVAKLLHRFFFFLFASFQCQPGAGWHCQMNLFSFLHCSDVCFLTSPKVTSILLHLALLLLSKEYLRLQGACWHFRTASCSAAFWEWAKFSISESNDNDNLAKQMEQHIFIRHRLSGIVPDLICPFSPPFLFKSTCTHCRSVGLATPFLCV